MFMTSVQNFGYYGIMVWLPTILLKDHGLTTGSMAGWMVVTVIGMIAGIYAFGALCDRFGRKRPYMAFYILSALMVYIYSGLQTPLGLLIGGLAPWVIGLLAQAYSFGWALLILCGIYVTAAFVVAIFIPETRNTEIV